MTEMEHIEQHMAILSESIDGYDRLIQQVKLEEDALRKIREKLEQRRQVLTMELAVEEKVAYHIDSD